MERIHLTDKTAVAAFPLLTSPRITVAITVLKGIVRIVP